MEWLKAALIVSFSLGLWTALNLLLARSGERALRNSLLAFVAVLLLPPLNAYVALVRGQEWPMLSAFTHQLSWCYGPLALLMVRHILLQKTTRKQIFLHGSPFVFALLYELSELSWPSPWLMVALRFCQTFAYLGFAIYLLHQHRQRINNLATAHQNSSYYWLLYLVAALTVLMILDVIIVTALWRGWLPSLTFLGTIGALAAAYVDSMALFALHQPVIFFPRAEKPEPIPVEEKPTLRSVELSRSVAEQLSAQLQQVVIEHKPHLDDEISLAKLATLLGVSSHQLSELLNVHKGCSFYDYLNALRHEESLLLLNNKAFALTIADVAYQSGFNNRNTFYKVFKEKTGMTPQQYRSSRQAGSAA